MTDLGAQKISSGILPEGTVIDVFPRSNRVTLQFQKYL